MKKPIFIAIAIIVLLIVWMGSGAFSQDVPKDNKETKKENLFSVETTTLVAQETPVYIKVQGQTVPNRIVEIKAQTEGIVEAIKVQEGSVINKNGNILALQLDSRQSQLAEQEALLASREASLKRLKSLAAKQYQSESELEQAQANVKASLAAIDMILLDIAHTKAKAPFTGVVQKIEVEEGEFVQVGDSLATIVENTPLIAELQVSQQVINQVALGTNSDIKLATGELVTGTVRYISPQADMQTRTFLVELLIDNPNGRLKAGTSATAKLQIDSHMAHYISPALFSLNEQGTIGVKAIDTTNTVKFYPINIVQSDNKGSWVTGMPTKVNVISSGQGFVQAGSKVHVHNIKDKQALQISDIEKLQNV